MAHIDRSLDPKLFDVLGDNGRTGLVPQQMIASALLERILVSCGVISVSLGP